jgi:hypothetical protein
MWCKFMPVPIASEMYCHLSDDLQKDQNDAKLNIISALDVVFSPLQSCQTVMVDLAVLPTAGLSLTLTLIIDD